MNSLSRLPTVFGKGTNNYRNAQKTRSQKLPPLSYRLKLELFTKKEDLRYAPFQKPIKTNKNKEKQVFNCTHPVFLGFTLFC